MDTNKRISRFEAREQCFLLTFEKLFNPDALDVILESAIDSRDLEFCDYAIKVTNGIDEHINEIDAIISTKLKSGWSISRI